MGSQSANNETDSYDAQFLLCLCLILLVVVSLGIYIIKLNAEVDQRRAVAMERLIRCKSSERLPESLRSSLRIDQESYCEHLDVNRP